MMKLEFRSNDGIEIFQHVDGEISLQFFVGVMAICANILTEHPCCEEHRILGDRVMKILGVESCTAEPQPSRDLH